MHMYAVGDLASDAGHDWTDGRDIDLHWMVVGLWRPVAGEQTHLVELAVVGQAFFAIEGTPTRLDSLHVVA